MQYFAHFIAIIKRQQCIGRTAVIAEIFGLNPVSNEDTTTKAKPSPESNASPHLENEDEGDIPKVTPAFSSLLTIVEGLIGGYNDLEGEVNAVKKAQNATDQYSRRNSFLLHKLKNIPVHLKGIKFAMWVANELNRRLRGLSHEITYHDIDAAHQQVNKLDDN